MQVQNSNAAAFGAKQRFLNTNQYNSMKLLLTRMNAETQTYYFNKTRFSTTITKELYNPKEKTRLIDNRMIFDIVPYDKQMVRNTILSFNKTEVVIDNKTGEITDCRKSIFTPWRSIMKKIDASLQNFNDYFQNGSIVVKKQLTFDGFTKKGLEILEKLKGKQ